MSSGEQIPFVGHFPGRLRLRGKSCLFIGAGLREVGVIARLFAVEGASILAVDQQKQVLAELVNKIKEEGGSANFHIVPEASLAVLEDILALLKPARPIDIIVVEAQSDPKSFRNETDRLVRLHVIKRVGSAAALGDAAHAGAASTSGVANTISFQLDDQTDNEKHWSLTRQIAYAALFLASDETNIDLRSTLTISVDLYSSGASASTSQ